jgi:hypothetical protein
MKLLALLLTLTSLSAAAETLPTKDLPPAPVLRMAKVKGNVNQFFSADNGHIDAKELCAFEGEAPVYDDLGSLVGYRLGGFNKVCDLTFGGKEMRVQVMAMLYHVPAKDGLPRKKSLQVTVFVFEKANGRMYFSQNGYSSSDDLDVKTMGHFMAGGTYEGARFPKNYPGFDTSVSIVDDARN